MKTSLLLLACLALAAAGCVHKAPRWTSVPSSKSAGLSQPPLRIPEPIRLWTLMPEATSQPAVLVGKKQDIVSGEYSFASFQALLRLIGRVEEVRHEVLFIRFFEGFAATVEVDGHRFHCARSSDGEWQIVGVTFFVADDFGIPEPKP